MQSSVKLKAALVSAVMNVRFSGARREQRRINALAGEKAIHAYEAVNIGGIPQWLQIRGESRDNPVLLILHGGPGSALTAVSHFYQREWERKWTVVNWDQRCAGQTALDTPGEAIANTMTIERCCEDTLEVIRWVLEKLQKQKLTLLGQSWGTMIGSLTALRHPELLEAYIGTGQVIASKAEWQVCIVEMLKRADAEGDAELKSTAKDLLKKAESGELKWGCKEFVAALNKLMFKCGFVTDKYKGGKVLEKLMIQAAMTSPDISPRRVLAALFDEKHTLPAIWGLTQSDEFVNYDIRKYPAKYQTPFYQINGDNDFQTPHTLAKEYFDTVQAPRKEWFTLENSGHMVQVDNNEQLTAVLCGPIWDGLFSNK